MSPNAARVLHQLGLAEALAKSGVPPLAWHQRRWDDGRTLLPTPLAGALEAAFGFPQYQIHRADLLAALAQALPADRVHLGHQLTGLADHGDHVQATFANGAQAEVEVLVGGDGIHSTVRSLLFGPQEPHFTGCIAYRGLVPADRLAGLELEVTAQLWIGAGWALHPLLRPRPAPALLRRHRRAGHLDPRVMDRTWGILPTPRPPSPAGTPRYLPS